jgi:hypothetical protein
MAAMSFEPTGRTVEQMASPLLSGTAVHPGMTAPPAVNSTEPVGDPVAGATALTVAVRASVSPSVAEVGVALSVVDEVALASVSEPVTDEVRKFEFPEYWAARDMDPIGRVVTQVATPLVTTAALQPVIAVPPFSKSTVPDGTPAEAPLTVAVKVSDSPATGETTLSVSAVVVGALAMVNVETAKV